MHARSCRCRRNTRHGSSMVCALKLRVVIETTAETDLSSQQFDFRPMQCPSPLQSPAAKPSSHREASSFPNLSQHWKMLFSEICCCWFSLPLPGNPFYSFFLSLEISPFKAANVCSQRGSVPTSHCSFLPFSLSQSCQTQCLGAEGSLSNWKAVNRTTFIL